MKKWIVRLGIIFVVLLLVGVLLAFLSLNSIVKAGVEKAGPMVTQVDVKLGSAAISPFSGSGELKDFILGNPEGFKTASAISVGEIKLALVPGSLLSDKMIVRTVQVKAPMVTYELGGKGSNLQTILDNIQRTLGSGTVSTNQAEKSPASKKLQVDEFVITGGTVQVSASMMGGKTISVPLPEIRLAGLGQGPEGITTAELAKQVFSAVMQGAVKASAQVAGNLGKETINSATEAGKGAMDKIGDLFKKK